MGFLRRRKQEKQAVEEALEGVRSYTDRAEQVTAKAEQDLGTDMASLMSAGERAMADGSIETMMAYSARLSRLVQAGVEAPAVVRAVELGSPTPLQGGIPAQLRLSIEPSGATPYDVVIDQFLHESMARALAPGGRVTAKVDPADPQSAIVWSTEPTRTPASDPDERLAKLEELRNRGVLTDAEFEVQRAKLEGT